MKKIIVSSFILIILTITAGYSDGAMFYQGFEGVTAEDAQQVIVMYNEITGAERLYLSVSLQDAPATNACWIIATPTLPEFSEESNFYVYTALKNMSDPSLYYYFWYPYYYDDYYGCGCYNVAYDEGPETTTTIYTGGEVSGGGQANVTVWYSATNADYDVTVFSTAGTNLTTWLTDNGYSVNAGYETILNYYAGEGWYFVAIRFDNAGLDSSIFAQLDFINPQPVFPLYISGVNSAETQKLQILYLSQHRVTTSDYRILNVPISNVNYLANDPGGAYTTTTTLYEYYNYLGYWDYYEKIDALSSSNSNNVLFLEFADQIYLNDLDYNLGYWYYLSDDEIDGIIREVSFIDSPIWLTRFYTVLTPENMQDITFVVTNNYPYRVYKYIDIYDGTTNVYYNDQYYSMRTFFNGVARAGAEFSLLALPLGFIFIRKRKRK